MAQDRAVEILKHARMVKRLAREICEWAPQSGDLHLLRRLLDVGTSLLIAAQAARGGYVPDSWVGDANVIMRRISDEITEFAAGDPMAEIRCYCGLAAGVVDAVDAACQRRFGEHLRALEAGAQVKA